MTNILDMTDEEFRAKYPYADKAGFDPEEGWKEAGRILTIICPKCGNGMRTELEYGYSREEEDLEIECDACGTEFMFELHWHLGPDLLSVKQKPQDEQP